MSHLIMRDVVIEECSNGTVVNGKFTKYEYIKINGERYRKVGVENYLDNFVQKALASGEKVTLSFRHDFGERILRAIRMSDGELIKADKQYFLYWAVCFVVFLFNALFVSSTIAYQFESFSLWIVLVIVVPIVTYFLMLRSSNKVRNI